MAARTSPSLQRLSSRLFKSAMLRHVAVLAGGQGAAAAIPVLTAPILGRLYTPTEYGLLGAYMSVAVVVASLGNWQYAQAIVLEERDARAHALVRVCVWTSLLTAAVSILVPVLAAVMAGPASSLEGEKGWLWLLPLSALLGGVSGAFSALANRFKRYREMATVQVLAALATAAVSIGLGWKGLGAGGLMTGYFTGQAATFFGLWHLVGREALSAVRATAPAQSRALLIRHRAYALYTTPTTFVEQLTMNVPLYALSFIGAPAAIGLFSRARQLLAMPLNMIAGSVAQVYQQRAAAEIARIGNCREVYARTFVTLMALGIGPAVVLAVFAPALFELYLGPKWREAGDVTRILAPMMLLNVICSPLARVFYIRHEQRLDFHLSIASAVFAGIATAGAALLGATANGIIAAYAATASLTYIAYIVIGWRLAQPRSGP